VEKYGVVRQATYDIIWRMHFACWVTKAINTLTICNTYCYPTATVVTRTRLRVALYSCCFKYAYENGNFRTGLCCGSFPYHVL